MIFYDILLEVSIAVKHFLLHNTPSATWSTCACLDARVVLPPELCQVPNLFQENQETHGTSFDRIPWDVKPGCPEPVFHQSQALQLSSMSIGSRWFQDCATNQCAACCWAASKRRWRLEQRIDTPSKPPATRMHHWVYWIGIGSFEACCIFTASVLQLPCAFQLTGLPRNCVVCTYTMKAP